MGFAEIVAFIKAFPLLVEKFDQLIGALKDMKQDKIDKEIELINHEVSIQIQILSTATSDAERKQALVALARATKR